MSELPEGWQSAPIGLLCTLENGRAFKPSDWRKSGIPIVRIQNLNDPRAEYNFFEGEFDERYHLHGGELLFAWSGTPGTSFGAHIWRGGEAVLNQHIFRVDFDESLLDKRFFRHAINQKLGELINIAHGGVGLRHVTKGKFESTEVAMPPFPEQKRVADKLDAVLARVDACRERLNRMPAILELFRRSVLAAATSGRLTEDWREAQRVRVNSWQHTVFETVCKEITVGHVGKMVSQYRESGIPFLRSMNVRPLRFDSRDIKYISPEFHRSLTKSALRPGDVVVVRTGAPGQCCVIPNELPEANCSDLVIVRPGPDLTPEFAAVFINSETSQEFVKAEQVGVAQAHFNVGSMKRAPIPVPTLPEQHEIVRRVKTLLEFADRLDARCTAARAQVERLTPSLLAKAFRGELVPQNPNDEPASVLLERIRAARAADTAIPKRGKTERKLGMTKFSSDSVLDVIRQLPQDHFTFGDLRDLVTTDYDTLKEVLFDLLQETNPSFKQEFDPEAGEMRFVRLQA